MTTVSLLSLGLALNVLDAADADQRKETALAKLAAQMRPGEWAELKTEGSIARYSVSQSQER